MSIIPLPRLPTPPPTDLSSVTLRTGPPTRGEVAKFYPPRYTWKQCKALIMAGDLSLLKRDSEMQKRYTAWAAEIKLEHGSITNYLLKVRLGWDEIRTPPTTTTSPWSSQPELELDHGNLPGIPNLAYFTSEASAENVKIIFNDWPYAIPPEILHYVIWSRLPIVHPAVVHPSIADQVNQDGLWGFTGDARSHDNMTEGEDNVYRDTPQGTSPEARAHILAAAANTQKFVSKHWPEDQWETAWFVNPPRIQSVKDLSHIHVFARRK